MQRIKNTKNTVIRRVPERAYQLEPGLKSGGLFIVIVQRLLTTHSLHKDCLNAYRYEKASVIIISERHELEDSFDVTCAGLRTVVLYNLTYKLLVFLISQISTIFEFFACEICPIYGIY